MGVGETAARLHSPSAPHPLEAGGTVSEPRQGAEEDRELRPPQGRREGPSLTSLHPLPTHSILFNRNRSAGQRSCHFLAALAERSELATDGGGSKARFPGPAAAWQRCSPCSTRRTHFPRWLGSAAELVGISGEGGKKLPPSRGGNHSTVKDARHPGPPVILEEINAALGKGRPLCRPLSSARSGGKVLEEAGGLFEFMVWQGKR